jgi:transposase
MDDQTNQVGARPGAVERAPGSGAVVLGRRGRMSRQRKNAAVLRLLRGEDLGTVSRELGVTAARLTGWRDAFLAGGEAALASRAATGEELESERLKAKLGAALIERDLLNEKIALLEAGRPFARKRRKPGAAPSRRLPVNRTVWPRSAGCGGSPARVCIATYPSRRRQWRNAAGRSARCRMRR